MSTTQKTANQLHSPKPTKERVDKLGNSYYKLWFKSGNSTMLFAKELTKEAIECFEIAQSLEPSASSLHNVGLIYFETENYDKAALAFEQALAMDSDHAARHIAYAKVQEKIGNDKKMIEALERAVELDPIPQTLTILADAYDRTGEALLALDLRQRAAKMIIPQSQNKVKQPRRVVM